MSVNTKLLELLICPACQKKLEPVYKAQAVQTYALCCPKCSLVYPVHNSIPVLIKSEAINLITWQGKGS